MRTFKLAAAYFVLVFGAGFALGIVRVSWLVARWGERAAELAEMPLMFVVIVLAARWVARRGALQTAAAALGVGFAAVGLLLLAEAVLVVALQARSLADYVAGRDPVAGGAYLALLLLMALLPWLLARRRLPPAVG